MYVHGTGWEVQFWTEDPVSAQPDARHSHGDSSARVQKRDAAQGDENVDGQCFPGPLANAFCHVRTLALRGRGIEQLNGDDKPCPATGFCFDCISQSDCVHIIGLGDDWLL